jgi:phospholipid/cholesterol/gamma-HCH transport system substrate-binding protein
MPRTRSLAWAELKIGVLAIVALVITAIAVVMLTGPRGFFWQQYSLKTRFPDVAGLRAGSPVRVAGVEIGTVDAVDFVGEEVEVTMRLNENMQERITTESTASLGSVSLLGESAVDITPSTGGTPIPPGGSVPFGGDRPQLDDVAERASRGVEELTGLVQDLRAGKGTAGRLLTDEALYVELRRFAQSAGDLTDTLREGRGTIGRLLNDPKAAETLERSLASIETVTKRLEAGEGTLGKLLTDDSLSRSISAASANLDAITARINRGEGTAGKLVTDDQLYARLTSVTDRLDQFVAQLNSGQGTAGQLLKDDRLYENMNGAVSDLRTLIAEIRKDPRRYLTVRVSIF